MFRVMHRTIVIDQAALFTSSETVLVNPDDRATRAPKMAIDHLNNFLFPPRIGRLFENLVDPPCLTYSTLKRMG